MSRVSAARNVGIDWKHFRYIFEDISTFRDAVCLHLLVAFFTSGRIYQSRVQLFEFCSRRFSSEQDDISFHLKQTHLRNTVAI